MSELVTIQDKNGTAIYAYDRSLFYDEQILGFKQGVDPEQFVHIIDVFLINRAGELIIQKRSSSKRHNPNLLDKTIGGHVQRGDPVDFTTMLETVQELQVPSIVIKENDDFKKKYELLKDYLHVIALIKHIDTKSFILRKSMKEGLVPIGNHVHLFFGVYGGAVKNIDFEAKGILFYNIDELIQEMKDVPQLFTDDLRVFIATYETQLREFIQFVIESP